MEMSISECCRKDNLYMFKEHLKNDEQINFDLCLKISVDCNSINICKFLIENNFTSKHMVYETFPLLTTSCIWNKDKTFKYLYSLDEHTKYDNQHYLEMNLEWIINIEDNSNFNILEFLIENGAKININMLQKVKKYNNKLYIFLSKLYYK